MFFDNVIYKLFHQYQSTEVDVRLDDLDRVLVVPELPRTTAIVKNIAPTIRKIGSVKDLDHQLNQNHDLTELPNAITYNITSKGGQCTVVLNEGATIRLVAVESSKQPHWILDMSLLDKQDVEIQSDRLVLGGVSVFISVLVRDASSRIVVVKQNRDVCVIDINSKSIKISQVDGKNWVNIKDRLRKLAQEDRLQSDYVYIQNYTHGTKNSGGAYYDVKNDRILFMQTEQIHSKSKEIDAIAGVFDEAKLGAVVGDTVYFYNVEHGTLWQVEAATGKVKAQYFLPLQSANMRIWQENAEIYIAVDYTYNTDNKGELVYRVGTDRMELINLRGNDIAALIGAEGEFLPYFADERASKWSAFHHARLIHTTVAPLATIYDERMKGGPYRYWVRFTEGKRIVITPNMPNITTDEAARLLFVGSVSPVQGPEIFYFFDPFKKGLYRQEGTHVLDGSKPNAHRISGEFANAKIIDATLFATTVDGLLCQIRPSGELSLEAINEDWLKKQGPDWLKQLYMLPSHHPLPVFGIKGIDRMGIVPAWYYKDKLILAPALQGRVTIEFLGIDDDGCARLFDVESGQLYKQTIAGKDVLSSAFGDDYILDNPNAIEVATALFPLQKIRSVALEVGMLRLVTDDGASVLLDDFGNTCLVGVNQEWQKAYPELAKSMKLLAEKWSHGGAVVLEGEANSMATWYIVELGEKIVVEGLTIHDKPQFIGVGVHHSNYKDIYINSIKGLQCYRYGANWQLVEVLSRMETVQRNNSSLVIEGTAKDDILRPLQMNGVTSVTLSGGAGSDTYDVDKEARERLKTIIIDNNSASDKVGDILKLYVKDHNEVLVRRLDDDLLLGDTDGMLVIRKVFGLEKADYDHLTLITYNGISSQQNSVVSLVNQMTNPFIAPAEGWY